MPFPPTPKDPPVMTQAEANEYFKKFNKMWLALDPIREEAAEWKDELEAKGWHKADGTTSELYHLVVGTLEALTAASSGSKVREPKTGFWNMSQILGSYNYDEELEKLAGN